MNGHTAPKNIIVLSASRSLTGVPVREVLAEDWKKANEATAQKFDNQGFDIDLKDFDQSLNELHDLLKQREWDGVIVGWCMRGYKERTVMFEQLMEVCVVELRAKPKAKIMFCSGPDDLYATTMRHFG